MKNKFVVIGTLLLSTLALASSPEELKKYVKLVEANVPQSFFELKYSDGSSLALDNGIGYFFEIADFEKNGKGKYLVIMYQASLDTQSLQCQISTIQIGTGKKHLAKQVILNDRAELGNCSKLTLQDLDGDGRPEVIISSDDTDTGLPNGSPVILKWIDSSLIDVTPLTKLNGRNIPAFRNLKISEVKIGKSDLMIDGPATYYLHGEISGHSSDQSYKTYLFKDGAIDLTGTYDFFQLIDKKTSGPVVTMNPSSPAAATYTLDMKNLSSHNRAVRAEVTVNGNVVLKPQDFCSAPPPTKSNQDAWKGNDDDDDKDEDHNKRCTPKKDVYAIVNLQTVNVIKVKLYGHGDSVVQFSLMKKP